jgi:hypothetical protein
MTPRANRVTHSDLYASPPLIAEAPPAQRLAIAVYRHHRDDPILCRQPNGYEVRLIALYLYDYIHAPIYLPSAELAELRRRVEYIRTLLDLANWLWDCRRIGIEPL